MDSPTLTTARLTLRPVAHAIVDADDALIVLGGPDMTRLSGLPAIHTRQAAWDFVNGMVAYNASGQGIALSIHTTTTLVGFIRLMNIDTVRSQATLSFEIGQPYWGNGYATEAVGETVRYGKANLNLAYLHANVHPANHASRHVLAKCGIGSARIQLSQNRAERRP